MARRTGIILLLLVWCGGAAAQDQTGKIVFYRESHFLTNDYKPRVFCDGAELALIAAGSYLEATAPLGRHVCVAESADGPETTIDVIPGSLAYVRVDIAPGTLKRHAFLVTTTGAEYNQQGKLKPMAGVLLTATSPAQASGPVPTTASTDTESHAHTANFGDLSVTATSVYTVGDPDVADKSHVIALVTVHNAGNVIVCPSLAAKLKTTFGFEYLGSPGAPMIRQVPPDETADRSYSFEVKTGVQPLELRLELQGGTTRCEFNSDSSSIDPSIPSEIRLDVRDLPAASASGGSGPPSEGIFQPGANGVGYPRCIYCPDPKYTPKARDARLEGTVYLQAVIGIDGTATDIKVVKSLGLGLDEQAVNAIQSWRFTPALGPNGYPVATIVPIEITFRLLK